MPCPIDAAARAEGSPKLGRVVPLDQGLDHQREAGEQDQVEGQDDERAPATHPAAQFLDADGRYAAGRPPEREHPPRCARAIGTP
ncbi:MAG: hypothetical protein WKF78_12700 [Candidatus Limnocylindrales bacterium]